MSKVFETDGGGGGRGGGGGEGGGGEGGKLGGQIKTPRDKRCGIICKSPLAVSAASTRRSALEDGLESAPTPASALQTPVHGLPVQGVALKD